MSPAVISELRRIVEDSEVAARRVAKMTDTGRSPRRTTISGHSPTAWDARYVDDGAGWDGGDAAQELEIVLGQEHISFCTSKIGSLIDVNDSKCVAAMAFTSITTDASLVECGLMCDTVQGSRGAALLLLSDPGPQVLRVRTHRHALQDQAHRHVDLPCLALPPTQHAPHPFTHCMIDP